MEYQKKLHDRHTLAEDHSRDWDFVTITNRFRTARVKFSLDTNLYNINLVALEIRPESAHGSGKVDVLHLRDKTKDGLREKIEQQFGSAAVFSTSSPELTLQQQHAAEVKAQREAADKQAAAAAEQERIVAASKELQASMSDAEVSQYRADNLNGFINSDTWRDWFKRYADSNNGVGFLNYPNNTGRNREALLRYCEQRGFRIPNYQVLDEGLRYLLNNGHVYKQNIYKRSMTDEFNNVVPFEQIQSDARKVYHTDEQIQQATKALQKVLPVGQRVNREFALQKARSIGISDAMFNDIEAAQSKPAPQVAADMSDKDLKRELQKMRPQVHPIVRARL